MVKYLGMVAVAGLSAMAITSMILGVDSGTVQSCITGVSTIMSGVIGYHLGKDSS